MNRTNCVAVATAIAVVLAGGLVVSSQASQDKAKDLDKVPKKVMDALKAKFPKAEIRKWTKEKEGDDVVYDFEFTENGRACEADIKEDGTYINFEKAITAKDLPAAVTKAINGKFPKATLKEIMEETEVTGKDEKLSAYEVVLVTADMKTIEVRLLLDGKIDEEEVLGGKQEKPEAEKAGTPYEFLKRFVGQWDSDIEMFLEPGKPPTKSKGGMTGHMIGNYWAILAVTGEFFGQPYNGQGTFGFDSLRKKKYIGTWADSMSDFLWHYEGTVDGNKLVFASEGPNPEDPAQMIKGRDTWEFKGKDQLVLTSELEGPGGKLMTMVRVTSTRKK